MAKTACEQEAEYLELRGHPHSARADALRAEGRELKRLRKLIVESDATSGWWSTEEMAERGVKVMDALQRETKRIQKARKVK